MYLTFYRNVPALAFGATDPFPCHAVHFIIMRFASPWIRRSQLHTTGSFVPISGQVRHGQCDGISSSLPHLGAEVNLFLTASRYALRQAGILNCNRAQLMTNCPFGKKSKVLCFVLGLVVDFFPLHTTKSFRKYGTIYRKYRYHFWNFIKSSTEKLQLYLGVKLSYDWMVKSL